MREVIALLRERVNDIVKGLEGQRCVQNSQHAIDSYTSFVCTFPGCENRAVCSRCILEDKEHINAHKKYLKTLEDFSEDSMDLCTDLFASEMDKVSAEVKTKFEKKVQFCASSCTEQITKILAEQFPLEMEEIVEVFNELIISHCESISHESQEKIKLLGSDFVNKTDKVQAGLNSNSKRTLERLIRFMSSKGEEEEHLWESAGKILHRQKHRIIYNKKLDEDLNSDIDKITAKYIRDVTETFRSYFIARETDVMSIIPIREEDSESEYEFVKDEFSMDENENSNSSAIHIQVTDNVQPQSRLARNVEIEAIQTVSVKPDRSPDNDKTRLDDQVPLSPLPHSPRQRARTEPPKLHHIENFRAIAGIGALVEDSSLSRAKKTHAFQMWLPNDSSKFSTMFTEDVRFFCIADLLRDGNDLARFMQHFYEAYYPGLFYIFLNYQSVSMTYPGLSWMEMNSLMRKCGIFNESFEERLCDEVYQDVLYTTKGVLVKEMTESVANSVESYLLRGGFMSYLTRVALLRYYMTGEKENILDALDTFMEIFLETAENCREEYEVKRMHEIHTEEVNQKVTFFLEQTKGIYEDVQHSDGYLYLQDLVDWLDLTELIVNENEVQRCFALSKMPVIKEFMIGGKNYNNMEYVEFLEFLVRISELDFYHDEGQPLHEKVQQTFQKLFSFF